MILMLCPDSFNRFWAARRTLSPALEMYSSSLKSSVQELLMEERKVLAWSDFDASNLPAKMMLPSVVRLMSNIVLLQIHDGGDAQSPI